MNITYLPYHKIDKLKWDNCILHAVNRLIYPQSFYLDSMAENWDGLVLNDYEAVMPLTWKKKWGIKYLYQPAFFQQGGIYFTKSLSPITLQAFIDEAFKHFKFAEITFNYLNDLNDCRNFKLVIRNNYLLQLNKKYSEICAGYPNITIKNLKRANNALLQYHYGQDHISILKLYEDLYAKKIQSFNHSDYFNFYSICNKLAEQNNLIIRKVTNSKNEVLAAVILLIDNNRFYNIVSCITKKGKLAQANYFLYDQLIQEFCNSTYILDFEGSDVKGIAEFYNRFQVINESYPFVKINKLHPFIKIFKR